MGYKIEEIEGIGLQCLRTGQHASGHLHNEHRPVYRDDGPKCALIGAGNAVKFGFVIAAVEAHWVKYR